MSLRRVILAVALAAGLPAVLATSPDAHAGRHHVTGQVVDRNNKPVDRALLSLEPGNVELVTDREGQFLIDYLRDASGKRVRFSKKTTYTLDIFRPGYHLRSVTIDYTRGPLDMGTLVLTEETIQVREDEIEAPLDLRDDPTHGAGATYEGQ